MKRVQGIWGRKKNGSINAKSSKKKENILRNVYTIEQAHCRTAGVD